MTTNELVEHFFRHEYGRLVAVLCRRFGATNIEAIEDTVQNALLAALRSWSNDGVPDRPTAWLYRVARNALVDELRTISRRDQLLSEHASTALANESASNDSEVDHNESFGDETLDEDQVRDDMLRLLFVCCDEAIPIRSQLVFALKTLCGFDVREISHRLFTSDANVYKRLSRAREHLRERRVQTSSLTDEQRQARLPAVRDVIYLVFTEGYLSSVADHAIRRELCDEAIRLGSLLAEDPFGVDPETCALVSLMHLHAARLSARTDVVGELVLLEEQNREQWDQQHIAVGLGWLARSAQGHHYSRYHAEAAIAAEHCLAPSFAATNWERVAMAYERLEMMSPTPLHRVNRAVAVAEWRGPLAGLQLLADFDPPAWLAESYVWSAVLSDLHRRAGFVAVAHSLGELAVSRAPGGAVQRLLERRLLASEHFEGSGTLGCPNDERPPAMYSQEAVDL